MGFTENYLERRKKRTGQSLTVAPLEKEAAPAASSGSRAGNDFTARYLARRESRTALPEVPPLSLPSLPGSAASSPAAQRAETKKPTVDFRGIPLAYSPDRAVSGANIQTEKQTGKASGFGKGGTRTTYQQGFQGTREPGRPQGRVESALRGAAGQYAGSLLSTLGTALEYKNASDIARPAITEDMTAGSELARQAGQREKKTLADEQKLAGAVRGLGRDFNEYGQAQVEQAKDGLNRLGQFAVDVGVGGAQLAADIGLGAATKLGTMGPLVLRSFGGSAEEAAQEGADLRQQIQYGAASALTEVLTEKISSLGNFNTKAFGSGALDDILEGAVAAVERMGKTDAGRKILNHAASAGIGFLSEGAEEFVSGVVSPLMKRAIYSKEPIDWKNVIAEAGYEFLVGGGIGALSGGIGGTNTGNIQQAYLSGVTERAQNDAYQAMRENPFSPEAREAARNAVRQMDEARTRTGAEPLGLPRLEEAASESTGVREPAPVVPQGQKNTAPEAVGSNTQADSDAPLVVKVRNAIPQMQSMQAVAEVNGTELPQGGKMVDRLVGFINKIGNKVNRPGFGDVLFSRGRLKNSVVGHGVGNAKIETFAAVPAVIERGTQIDYQENWKGRGYDTYTFAAPVTYKSEATYLGVIVTKDAQDSRYYAGTMWRGCTGRTAHWKAISAGCAAAGNGPGSS